MARYGLPPSTEIVYLRDSIWLNIVGDNTAVLGKNLRRPRWGVAPHLPADVFLPHGLLADHAVQEAVEGLEQVVV